MNKTFQYFLFIAQCLALDKHPELADGIRKKFSSGEIDVDRFIHLCSNHFILPAVFLQLKKANLLSVFPEDYKTHLEELYQLNRQRNKEILAQIEELNTSLAKEGIQAVYLKGTANLMDGLYSDLGERMIGDIDFLVQEKDYLKTIDLVKTLNYHSDVKMYDGLENWKHYPRLFRKDVPADVEIHVVPVDFPYAKKYNSEIIFQNKKQLNNYHCYAPSNEHRIIHTFIHSQLSNKGHLHLTIGLRDLYDAYLLLKKVDVEAVISETEFPKKAQIFFEYVNYLFSPGQNRSKITNRATLKFIKRHQWFLNHPRQHHYYITTLKTYDLIFKRYLGKILRAPFQKSAFKYIYNRLKDPKWYAMHLKRLRDQFK